MTYTLPTGNESIAGLYAWAQTTSGFSSYGILLIIFAVAFFGTQRFGAQLHHSLLLGWTTMVMCAGALMIMGALPPIALGIMVAGEAIVYFWSSQQ